MFSLAFTVFLSVNYVCVCVYMCIYIYIYVLCILFYNIYLRQYAVLEEYQRYSHCIFPIWSTDEGNI